MNARRQRIAMTRLVALRARRVEQREVQMRECRAALDAAQAAVQAAAGQRDAWLAAVERLRQWAVGAATELHRLTATYEARRRELGDGLAAADAHLAWCREQSEKAAQALEVARLAWLRERTRLDALQRKQREDMRRWQARLEESAADELRAPLRRTLQEVR